MSLFLDFQFYFVHLCVSPIPVPNCFDYLTSQSVLKSGRVPPTCSSFLRLFYLVFVPRAPCWAYRDFITSALRSNASFHPVQPPPFPFHMQNSPVTLLHSSLCQGVWFLDSQTGRDSQCLAHWSAHCRSWKCWRYFQTERRKTHLMWNLGYTRRLQSCCSQQVIIFHHWSTQHSS